MNTVSASDSVKTLLVVEDDEIYRSRLARAVTERGFRSIEVGNQIECQSKLQEESRVDYAIIDLKVGEDSGINILEELLVHSPGCRAVVLTGFGTISTSVRAIKTGAVDYLTKPTDPDTIISTLIGSVSKKVKDDVIPTPSLEQNEWEHIQRVLEDAGGNISVAAKRLGMHRRSLQRKLAKNPLRIR